MKGVTVAIADPIEPITEFDDRPAVKELIIEYHKQIDVVKKGLEDDPLYKESKHDDLWILRSVVLTLSHFLSFPLPFPVSLSLSLSLSSVLDAT